MWTSSPDTKGTVFSIEEFAVQDGPGLRTNIFFKGCPLRCKWCHNPEGWSTRPERVKSPNGCLHCGACDAVCPSPGNCILCHRCAIACPRGLIRFAGQTYTASALAERVKQNERMLREGGITLSGGEVLMQGNFLLSVLDAFSGFHRAIETSGYGDPELFSLVLQRLEMAYFDIKIFDEEKHRFYTGVSNRIILQNAETLKKSGVPFTIRIPLITEVNLSDRNLLDTAAFLQGCPTLQGVELLPYNKMAGAKYAMLGRTYEEIFTQPDAEQLAHAVSLFTGAGIPCTVRR
ncbi:MAG: glycyl-radical enzyme activating protein [Clostridia bacterium]|nr:glycyl-radical enzyme activating protein [Clostridia bacterium]